MRGLTPRNVSPQKNKADEKVKTYADVIEERLNEVASHGGSKRFVNIDIVSDSVERLACGECAKEEIGKAEDKIMTKFRQFVAQDENNNTVTMNLIDKFERQMIKNKKRRMDLAEDRAKVCLTEDVVGISSDIIVQCQSCPSHCYPMSAGRIESKGQKKSIDADENLMAILLPFITGVGPRDVETILSIQGLPNSKHYEKTITRWQPSICKKIIEISEREMKHAMAEEIKQTIIADKGEAYYASWINKPFNERDKVGLVVSYDMGWQKRASGNAYSSKSGHAFVVGMQTRRIIDCVVFSTNCKRCECKPKRKGEGDHSNIAGMWMLSLSQQESSLADDGAVAETNTDLQIPAVTPNTDIAQDHERCLSPTPVARSLNFCQPTRDTESIHQSTHRRAVHPLEQGQIVSPEQMSTNVLEPSTEHQNCPCNYDGSPGSMESNGMLWLMKRLYKMMSGSVYYEFIVSDDDTTMKKYLTHPEKRPRGEKNIGGRLPKEIPVPTWFADPTHRAKCVAGKFFNYNKSEKNMSKLDCLRLKKYYSYYIKCNRKKSLSEIMDNIMAPIDHLFDDHTHCESSWCHKKAMEENKIKSKEIGSERSREGYYRCKVKDKELYESLCDLYRPYITEERIGQCKHEFETQVNEGMNTCVAKYAPKGRHYSKTISLEARVKIAAGIYNVGYHFFWTEIMKGLGIDIEPSLEEYLLKKDLDKLQKFNRDHDHTNMAKQKKWNMIN